MALHSKMLESAEKTAKGIRNMTIEKDGGGKGYIVTHHMNDMMHPKDGVKHACPSCAALSKHVKKHMPLEKEEDGED
jgi:hypothetical protein